MPKRNPQVIPSKKNPFKLTNKEIDTMDVRKVRRWDDSEAGLYTPFIIPSKGKTTIQQVLQVFFSNSQITRLKKQNGIKIAHDRGDTWIKVGQRLFIIDTEWKGKATRSAYIHWRYYCLMKDEKKKLIDWKKYEHN